MNPLGHKTLKDKPHQGDYNNFSLKESHLVRIFWEQKTKKTPTRSHLSDTKKSRVSQTFGYIRKSTWKHFFGVANFLPLGLYYVFLCRVGCTTPTYGRPQEWGRCKQNVPACNGVRVEKLYRVTPFSTEAFGYLYMVKS